MINVIILFNTKFDYCSFQNINTVNQVKHCKSKYFWNNIKTRLKMKD